MAADRLVTDGDSRYNTRKIRRFGDCIVGCAGTGAAISKFYAWFPNAAEDEPPKMSKDDELVVLVLTPAGLFIYGNDCVPDEVLDEFYAVGTGAHAALAALHLGCNPERAVEIAAKVDNSTGLPVDSMTL